MIFFLFLILDFSWKVNDQHEPSQRSTTADQTGNRPNRVNQADKNQSESDSLSERSKNKASDRNVVLGRPTSGVFDLFSLYYGGKKLCEQNHIFFYSTKGIYLLSRVVPLGKEENVFFLLPREAHICFLWRIHIFASTNCASHKGKKYSFFASTRGTGLLPRAKQLCL